MKKFWKNLGVCAVVLASTFTFGACKKTTQEVAVDLDGDGVISAWEQLYEWTERSTRVVASNEIIEITDLAGLLAINDNVSDTKVYKLANSIDCGGREISINLGTSTLLGDNRVIKNFKLANCIYYDESDPTQVLDTNIKGLFYNGSAIYDLRIFFGNQSIDITEDNNKSVVSTFINVPLLDNIEVRGKLKVDRKTVDGLAGENVMDVSLVGAEISEILPDKANDIYIKNSIVTGEIIYTEDETNTTARIGSVMPNVTKKSLVYNINSSVNINASSSGTLCLGGIVGNNENMVSTCISTGKINATYTPNFVNRIGGIAGNNSSTGEIKNCRSQCSIDFVNTLELSSSPELYMGGIVGSNYGVLSYVTNDSNLTVNQTPKCKIGGVAGFSKMGIVNNVISRGSIKCYGIPQLYVSEMIGMSQGGYYETGFVTTNVTVDNGQIASRVYLGMLTMFEFKFDDGEGYNSGEDNVEYSPMFRGFMLAGKNEVYMRDGVNGNEFVYNLGLRNDYKYTVINFETGDPEPDLDNPIEDEEGNVTYPNKMKTLLPIIFDKLFMLDTYSVSHYSITGENKKPTQLVFEYAKDDKAQNIVSPYSSSKLNDVKFYINYLGFRYGLNHNEVDLSVPELDKINFTLKEEKHLSKYFENIAYGGEHSNFDKFIDKKCTFDINDEMFSFINSIFTSDKTYDFHVLKVSSAFIKSQPLDKSEEVEDEEEELPEETEEEEIIISTTLGKRFVDNIEIMLKKVYGNNVNNSIVVNQYTSNMTNIEDLPSSDIPVVKYIEFVIENNNYRYKLRFDVSEMEKDVDMVEPFYITYVTYERIPLKS